MKIKDTPRWLKKIVAKARLYKRGIGNGATDKEFERALNWYAKDFKRMRVAREGFLREITEGRMKFDMYNEQELTAILGLMALMIAPALAFGINKFIDGVAIFLLVLFSVLLFGILIKFINFRGR